jgi:AraC-like DNA-binding protein
MQRARERAKIPDEVKLYGLRHAFGTRAILNGVDIKTLAELLGHTTTRMSEHYIHLAGQPPRGDEESQSFPATPTSSVRASPIQMREGNNWRSYTCSFNRPRRVCQVRDLLRDHLSQPLTLGDCADEVDLSPWHLLRSFRAAFGETPHAYLTRVRIDRAARLIALTDRSVTEVCFDVGFTSLGSFSTLFKRHTGWSPAAYRRRVRGWVSVPAASHPRDRLRPGSGRSPVERYRSCSMNDSSSR